ncbi:hypothetical protein SDC9_53713 [bioreactor metagenome]|uniref:Uncharacterized protein n=1 Tax=bioreactor metagenome TaxID=1076179 RepID=A0A644WUP0_9ZZZZ
MLQYALDERPIEARCHPGIEIAAHLKDRHDAFCPPIGEDSKNENDKNCNEKIRNGTEK